ncbi:hypothetical protein J6590_042228 [Homalodisca vitripennis]|nr:hypothetical protein J6590_042228 [Homalodisca vitripennis]
MDGAAQASLLDPIMNLGEMWILNHDDTNIEQDLYEEYRKREETCIALQSLTDRLPQPRHETGRTEFPTFSPFGYGTSRLLSLIISFATSCSKDCAKHYTEAGQCYRRDQGQTSQHRKLFREPPAFK